MRDMKKQFYVRWDELLLILGVQAGFFLFGQILLAVMVFAVGDKESVFPLGTLMAIIAPVFLMMFLGMSSLPIYFNTAVGLGAARRHVVPAMLGFSMLINIAAACEAYLFYFLEKWIFRVIYTGIKVEMDLRFVFQWKYIFTVCLAIVAVNALMAAAFLKYGRVAFTVFWILWMLVFVGGPRLAHLLESTKDNAFLRVCRRIVDLFLGFSENGILAAAVLICTGIILISWLMMRKQQVSV